jgi:pyrroloquinoline quinone (PQQ) biosynthesis protein C
MTAAIQLIESIRAELAEMSQRLLTHPYVAAVEQGRVQAPQLRPFACEQHLIISSDLRSVAHLVCRFGTEFFLDVLQGERSALAALSPLAAALGIGAEDLRDYEPLPGAQSYSAYMAWMAAYASEAEVAAAYLVNFQAWGANCKRLGSALRNRYGLDDEQVAFFDLFATPVEGFEESALAVIRGGLDAGLSERLVRRAPRMLQGYELLYWDTLYAALDDPREAGP